eukprot:1386093-Prymnesium_polylepis.1
MLTNIVDDEALGQEVVARDPRVEHTDLIGLHEERGIRPGWEFQRHFGVTDSARKVERITEGTI